MRALVIACAAAACNSSSATPQSKIRVAAASDLAHVFDELAPAFTRQTGIALVVDFGASGVLANQIADGAPYYLFAAASPEAVARVVASGRCDRATMRAYARGRLAVWSRSDVVAPTTLAELVHPRFARIAIANPEHAPYGRAAKQALHDAGLWDAVEDRIVIAEDVQGALQAARSRRADAALVSLSLADVHVGGWSISIDERLYDPLEQTLIVCGSGPEADAARRLARFIDSSDAREIMIRYGLPLPRPAAPTAR